MANTPAITNTATNLTVNSTPALWSQLNRHDATITAQTNTSITLSSSLLASNTVLPLSSLLLSKLQQLGIQVVKHGQQLHVITKQPLTSLSVVIPPQLQQLVSQLSKTKPSSLPEPLLQLIAKHSELPVEELTWRIQSLTLTNLKLTAHLINSDVISTIAQNSQPVSVDKDTLVTLFQLVLPFSPEDTKVTVNNQPQQQTSNESDAGIYFEMNFSLANLGQLAAKVRLQQWQLTTDFCCSSTMLLNRLQDTLPLLEERLNKLGFQTRFDSQQLVDDVSEQQLHKGLVDIKV